MLLRFKYKFPQSRSIIGLVVCLAIALSLSYLAYTNQQGLRAFRLFTFSVNEASIIFWSLALVFAILAILFCVLLARNHKEPVSLVLDETSITAPTDLLKGELLVIPYASITQVLVSTFPDQEIITINSSIGQAGLSSMGFSNASEFMKFKKAFAERTNGKPA